MWKIKKIRLPTIAEWNALVAVSSSKNHVLHWETMLSWCQDAAPDWQMFRAVMGWTSADYRSFCKASSRHACVGLRPALEVLNSDALGPDGTIVVAGTLYMDGQPVKNPENPIYNGDIANYTAGTRLELRDAMDDPAYQVQAIKVGNVLVADRVLLRYISWEDCNVCLNLGFTPGKQLIFLNGKGFLLSEVAKKLGITEELHSVQIF